ncbi:hypothetical protein HID58_092591 [Brassica napus]|uniref:Uncharacterized protein n=1 Tax=Brassica napus TaxID=3708 RepID=A0ABQ7XG85_BRANA|nr:hypothetical protein HID58_092591 [Brassica napus]
MVRGLGLGYDSCSRMEKLLSANGATRVYPEAPTKATSPAPANNQENLMKKYFGAGKFPPVNSYVGKGTSDTKRTVPSCPDPLHN